MSENKENQEELKRIFESDELEELVKIEGLFTIKGQDDTPPLVFDELNNEYKFAYSNNFGLEIGVLAKSLQQAQQEVEELRQDYETDEAILDDLTSYFHYDGRGAQHSELIECAEAVCEQILELQAENARLREALEKIAEINKPTKLLGIFKADFWDMEQELTYVIAKQALKAKE